MKQVSDDKPHERKSSKEDNANNDLEQDIDLSISDGNTS